MATKTPKAAAFTSTTSPDETESAPQATSADLTETQGLPEATSVHLKGPSLVKASLFATPEAKKTLDKHKAWVTLTLGQDAATVLSNATATVHSGRRTQRIASTYNRSCEDHQANLTISEAQRVSLLNALRPLPEASPVRKDFEKLLEKANMVQGTDKAVATKEKNKKEKAAKKT